MLTLALIPHISWISLRSFLMPVAYFDYTHAYSPVSPPPPGCFSNGHIHSQNLRGAREGDEGHIPVSERRGGAWTTAQRERGGAKRAGERLERELFTS